MRLKINKISFHEAISCQNRIQYTAGYTKSVCSSFVGRVSHVTPCVRVNHVTPCVTHVIDIITPGLETVFADPIYTVVMT